MINNKNDIRPLASIALTTFNGEKFLKQQLDSLLMQTYQNFEIIISDDGSDEGSIQILNEYSKKDKRIKWSKSPLPRGYINNTQNAISLCSGDIIFLCDQDDTWYKEKIQIHIDAYKDKNISWVYNKLVITDENNNKIGYLEDSMPNYYSKKRIKLMSYTWGSCIGGAMTSYKSTAIKESLPIGGHAHGHDSWIQFFLFPKKPFFINKVLQTYRQHSSNQVGWSVKKDIKETENLAIRDNMLFLKYLPTNRHLQTWKRILFWFIYKIKLIRNKY